MSRSKRSWVWAVVAAVADRKVRITQVRSGVGRKTNQQRTLEALGFKRHQQTVVHTDGPALRGMIYCVRHLVKVEDVNG